MEQISLRIDKKTMKKTKKLSELERLERSVILRQALERGLEDLVKEVVVELYRKDKITLSEAADLANLGAGELLELLKEHGIRSKISLKDLEEGKKAAEEIV